MNRILSSAYTWAILLLFSMIFAAPTLAYEVTSVNVSHAKFMKDSDGRSILRGYAEFLSDNSKPVTDISSGDISAVYMGKPMKIKSFASYNDTASGTGYIFLLDTSMSLSLKQFRSIQNVICEWIDKMKDTDMAAVISFGDDVSTLSGFSRDKRILKQTVVGLRQTRKETRLNDAIIQALKIATVEKEGIPYRKVIVGFSDCINEAVGGQTKEEILDKLGEARIPIYFAAYEKKNPTKAEKKAADDGMDQIALFCRTSGGAFYRGTADSVDKLYADIYTRLLGAYIFDFDSSKLNGDGTLQYFELIYAKNGTSLKGGTDVRFSSEASDFLQDNKKLAIFAAVAGAMVIFVILLIIRRSRVRKATELEEQKRRMEAEAGKRRQEELVKAKELELRQEEKIRKEDKPAPKATVILSRRSVGNNDVKMEVQLFDRVVIGRSKNCDICLQDDKSVSGTHAELTIGGGNLYIRDMGSTNGTLLNGVPITGLYRLSIGDVISVGNQKIRISSIKLS